MSKEFIYRQIDEIVYNSINYGNSHFFVTINFDKIILLGNKKLLNNYIKNLEKFLISIELFSYFYITYKECKIDSIDCYYLVIFIAIRLLISDNNIICKNLENFFKKRFLEFNVKVEYIKNERKIRNKLYYCFENINNNYGLLLIIEEHYFYWANFSDALSVNFTTFEFKGFEEKEIFKGIRGVNNCVDNNILINLWSYYLIFNKLYIYNGCIYKKLENYLISFEEINNIQYLIDKFMDEIYPYFLKLVPFQFQNYPINNILNKMLFFENFNINNLEKLVTNKINIDYDLMEFYDGVYVISKNQFFSREIIKNQFFKKGTLKFFKKAYKDLSEPKEWLDNLNLVLGGNEVECKIICLYIATIFNKNYRYSNFFKKKKFLYIEGRSNSGKNILVLKPLINFFSLNNIIYINEKNIFNLENTQNIFLGILNIFKYNENTQNILFELLNNKNILIPIIIVSNKYIDIYENDLLVLESIENRILHIIFKNIFNKNENFCLNEILDSEEPNILIYCNKLLFNENSFLQK